MCTTISVSLRYLPLGHFAAFASSASVVSAGTPGTAFPLSEPSSMMLSALPLSGSGRFLSPLVLTFAMLPNLEFSR